jgi:hypothetical protein
MELDPKLPIQIAASENRDYITPEDVAASGASGVDKLALAINVLIYISNGTTEDYRLCAHLALKYIDEKPTDKYIYSLKDQIIKIAAKNFSKEFCTTSSLQTLIKTLASHAFVFQWPESWETVVIRRAYLLTKNGGHIHNEPAVPETTKEESV